MNRKIKVKIKWLLLLFVLKHLEIVNPHVSLSSSCQISIQGVRQNLKPNFWCQNSSAHPFPPCLEEPEKELRQAKLNKKSLCVVKVFYDQSLFCIRKRKATPVTSKQTVEIPQQGMVLQTWLMEDISTTRTVSISAGWLVKSPPCGMQIWLEMLFQRRWEASWTGQIPISRLPTLNQGSKSLSITGSNSRETLPQVHQEAGITMYMNPSDTSETWIQTQMSMDGRGNGQLVDSPTREHYTAFRMNEAAFRFQIRWNIGSRFTFCLKQITHTHTHTHTYTTTTITATTTSNNSKTNKIYQTNSFQDTGNQVMKGNDFWEIKN